MEWALLLLMGLQGYFTIFRLTPEQKLTTSAAMSLLKPFASLTDSLDKAMSMVSQLDLRLSRIETEVKLRAVDSGRIIEWLEKRDKLLVDFQQKIEKSMHLEEREKRLDHHQSEIIQLGKEIRLIREKK